MAQARPDEAPPAEEKQWLIPDADFARLQGLFYQFVSFACNPSGGKYELGRNQIAAGADEMIGGDPEKLKEFYVRLLSEVIADFIEVLQSDELKRAFDAIKQNESLGPQCSERTLAIWEYFGHMEEVIHRLGFLGFDRRPGEIKKSPLCTPFNQIDVKNPDWQKYLGIAENFQHAMKYLFDAHIVFGMYNALMRGRFVNHDNLVKLAERQANSLPGIISMFSAWRDQLIGNENELQVAVSEVAGERLGDLADFRFFVDKRFALPMRVNVNSGLNIEAGDANRLLMALFEVAKNAFRPGKVQSNDVYKEYAERGEPYMTVSADEVEFKGQKFIAIEVRDRGRWIDLNQIMKTLSSGDYEFRDYTVAGLLDMLSQRHLSIPLEEGGEMSTGIGLHSAYEAIQAHKGRMFYTNLKSGGVGCLVLIPVSGKAGQVSADGMGFGGRDLDAIAGQLSASEFFDGEIDERLRDYSSADGNMKAALLQLKRAVEIQRKFISRQCAGAVRGGVVNSPINYAQTRM